MNARGLARYAYLLLLTACAVALLLAACQPANVPPSPPPAQATATALPEPPAEATQAETAATEPAEPPATQPPATQPPASGDFSIDLTGVAQDGIIELIAAVPNSADRPWWEAAPQHRRVTLQGYPVAEHMHKPQIFIYPVLELGAYNEGAGRMATELQALIQAPQQVERMPFLPLFNASQVMNTHVQYLEFKNGSGVRYLTQYDQSPLPINNYEMMYTFQGLTSDGQYYIAAILPVTHPDLPATDKASEQPIEAYEDFPAYLRETAAWLNVQPGTSFAPDLTQLDEMMTSIEVK